MPEMFVFFIPVYLLISFVIFLVVGVLFILIFNAVIKARLIPRTKKFFEIVTFIFLTSLFNTLTITGMLSALLKSLEEQNIESIFFVPPQVFLIAFVVTFVFWLAVTLIGLFVLLKHKKK